MGSFMDLKLHLHWHAKPKIVVTCNRLAMKCQLLGVWGHHV